MVLKDIYDLKVPTSVVDKTIDSTIKKYLYTIRNSTYERTPVELLDNLFMGDFAKNSLFYYLKDIEGKNVEDYDEIRTDNFEKADPGWDIRSIGNDIKIEVKSSIVPSVDRSKTNNYTETAENILNNRDVKITASHDKGINMIDPISLESDIHVQIYFLKAKTYKDGRDNYEELGAEIERDPSQIDKLINIKKYIDAKYFGYSTKQEIIDFKSYHEKNNIIPTWTFSWTKRLYWKSPLQEAHNLEKLLKII